MMTNYEYTRIDAENKALKKRIEKLENSIEQIRDEIDGIEINGQIDERTSFIRTGEQVKQMALNVIDKYMKGE